MKIINYTLLKFLLVFALSSAGVHGSRLLAQNSGALFMLPNNFYAQMWNPSFMRSDEATEFSVPLLGGFSFHHSASFRISSLVTIEETGNPVIDFENFYNAENKRNFVREDLKIPMFFYSKPIRNGRLSFYYRENVAAYTKFNMNAVEFLLNGNITPEYQSFYTDEIKMFGTGYREFSFGYAKRKSNKLDIGGHFKILFGSAFIELNNWQYGIETASSGETVHLISNGNGDMSIPMPIELGPNDRILRVDGDGAAQKYFTSFRNPGIAVDLGMTYTINEANVFSASLLDLGGIWFRYNTVDIMYDENYEFTGFDLTNAVRYPESGYVNPFTLFLDTKEEIRDVFRPVADTAKSFKNLSPKAIVHLTHKINDTYWFGMTNQSMFRKNFFWNALTFSAMQNLANFSVFESVNLYGTKSLTLGGGVQYEGKSTQVFLAADNIIAFYHPAANKTFSLTLGMCFLLHNEKNEKSADLKSGSSVKKSKGKIYPWRPFYREKN